MLKLKDVTKRYGDITAVENISFDVEDGEFIFITGPSGSGKSTILRLILRQVYPDSGEIEFEGKDLGKAKSRDIPKVRQKMGVVFQDFKMIPERTLRENIEVALAVLNVPFKEWEERVNHVAKLVGVSDRLDFFPSQLSGGELQRGALARALVVNPVLILADEPTGNLDWKTAEGIIELFEQINREGKTIVMATHHMGIIDKHKKRVIELNKGKIVSDPGPKKSGNKEDSKDDQKKTSKKEE